MSLGNDPRKVGTMDGHHAVAAAHEAHAELKHDGIAPHPNRILDALGRKPNGEPMSMSSEDPEPPHKAREIARELL